MKGVAEGEDRRRKRAVNRRVQGDVGEASAIEWLTSQGALVWTPLGHSPDADVLAQVDDRLLRVQVKTSTFRSPTPGGDLRWRVAIATSGGNRSWAGIAKRFDRQRVDWLFVLVGDGRRWLIPSAFVEGTRSIALGGSKYSEFEIEPGIPFEALVHPEPDTNRIGRPFSGECQSGQMDSTVNRAAMPTEVRILPPPSTTAAPAATASCQVLLRPKRQATIPKRPCEEAGLRAGDRMRVRVDGPGRVLLEKIGASSEPGRPPEIDRPRGASLSAPADDEEPAPGPDAEASRASRPGAGPFAR